MIYICINLKQKEIIKNTKQVIMTTSINFTKMQGAGNDYIYINAIKYKINDPENISIKWSASHTGIGSDGLVLIESSDIADFKMRIFNADGSEAMMCGNASRCIGKYVYEHGLTRKEEISLETLSGIKFLKLHPEKGKILEVTVDMDIPRLKNQKQISTSDGSLLEGKIEVEGIYYTGTFICMGNPHFVIFVNDLEKMDLSAIGPKIEHHPLFPERINVEFAQITDDNIIRMRVWERGSGITQACGTGACATAVAACLTKRCGRQSSVIMDGGKLDIKWNPENNHVYMKGPAVEVFNGEIEI